jgi:hypothetical protein
MYERLAWQQWLPLPDDPVRDRYLRNEYVILPPPPMYPVMPSPAEPE